MAAGTMFHYGSRQHSSGSVQAPDVKQCIISAQRLQYGMLLCMVFVTMFSLPCVTSVEWYVFWSLANVCSCSRNWLHSG